MKNNLLSRIKRNTIFGTVIVSIISNIAILPATYAAEGDTSIAMSPMNERVVLNPGDHYDGSFKITNPVTSSHNFSYKTSVVPFFVDEDYNVDLESNASYNQITEWITVANTEGMLEPNSSTVIRYSIDVPANAPAGGQYAGIKVTSKDSTDEKHDGLNIKVSMGAAYLIYAEIAGETIHRGEITDISVPSFLLSGNITGAATIKNTGNVHGIAKYTLQIFPLFSSEEAYTNEEDPVENTILPDRTLYNEITWENTPPVGIFNVVYTVEFEGVTQQVSKMVIKCPIWLLFIIIFAIVALIIWLALRAKNRGNKRRAEA